MGAKGETLARQFEAKAHEAGVYIEKLGEADLMALHHAGSTKAASVLRGLSDEELGKSGVIFQDAPPFTVEQFVTGALIGHTDDHMGSIRKTVGK